MIGKIVAFIGVMALSFMAYQHHVGTMAGAELDQQRQLWSSWKTQYGKTYATQQEDDTRFAIFVANNAKIIQHNAESQDTIFALNKFADLTGEEFSATYASCHGQGEEAFGDKYCPSAVNCPTLDNTTETKVDWVGAGAVTPVKDQGQCGSCWAFSTTGSLEGLYYINHTILLSFSEQQIVDCAQNCQGCNGCWPYMAMNYTATYGVEPEKVYPYKAAQGTCKYNKALAVHTNNGYQCVAQKSVSQLQAAVVIQPVSIAVEADQDSWQFYSSGVLATGCGAALDHAVLLTGYDTSKNAWTVKNSWGTDWGQQGYIYLSMDATANTGFGVCGVLRCPTVPTN